MSDDNIKLEIKDIDQDNSKDLTPNDLAAITELINNETENTSSFNKDGLFTGIGLLGAGLILTTVNLYLYNNANETKSRKIIRKTSSLLGIPLTTAGLMLTTYFALNVTHNTNIVL